MENCTHENYDETETEEGIQIRECLDCGEEIEIDLEELVAIDPPKEELIEEKPKVGRPSEYTKEMAEYICEQLAMGFSLRTVCKEEITPSMATVFKWMREHPEFLNQYAYAKQESADAMAEEILDLSDGAIGVIKAGAEKKSGALAQAVRLQVDTRKWLMSKMKPKKYADKIDLTTNGKDLPTPIYGGQSITPTDTDTV